MGPMTSRPLTPLADARARLLGGRGPVAAVRLPLAEAIGLAAAETIHAPHALPRTAVALRPGVAVASADLVGATPQAPALLPLAPPHVLIGEALPADADAVLAADAVAMSGPFAEIGQSAYPGENVRKAGGDLTAGTVIVAEGGLITAEVALALGCAGLTTVAVRRPAIRIEGPASPEATFLASLLSEAGCRVAEGTADLVITLVAMSPLPRRPTPSSASRSSRAATAPSTSRATRPASSPHRASTASWRCCTASSCRWLRRWPVAARIASNARSRPRSPRRSA